MSAPADRVATAGGARKLVASSRVAFAGSRAWLDGCAPAQPVPGWESRLFELDLTRSNELASERMSAFSPDVTIVFDPPSVPPAVLESLRETTLGVFVESDAPDDTSTLESLDRVVSFHPALTGAARGAFWRAIPPPVSDSLYRDVLPLHRVPRAMAIGRSSEHREHMLTPAKHHHDLLHVIHGVSGEPLADLLGEYDVGVYVARESSGGSFGHQVGVHLATGHLLLSEHLHPAHGLERNIDFLQVDSPDAVVWVLDRLARFPEMYHGIRVRGRMKAEQYRASRLFARVLHDVLADVAAFGGRRAASDRRTAA